MLYGEDDPFDEEYKNQKDDGECHYCCSRFPVEVIGNGKSDGHGEDGEDKGEYHGRLIAFLELECGGCR